LKTRTDFDANWDKWSTRQGHETINFMVQEDKGHGHIGPKYVTEISFGEISHELGLSDEF